MFVRLKNVDISPMTFELEPGESRNITLRFTAPTSANPQLFPIYSGFIYATNLIDGKAVHLSCKYIIFFIFQFENKIIKKIATIVSIDAGMVGDYSNTRILIRNGTSNYPTSVYDQSFAPFNFQSSILNATDGAIILASTAWATRSLSVEVVSADGDGSIDSTKR